MANVLVVGNGAREDALARKLAQSPEVATVYVIPGNDGTRRFSGSPKIRTMSSIPSTEIRALATFAEQHKVTLTVVGPEAPLYLGIVDEFRARDLPIFGPSLAAARIEESKVFAKGFMDRHGIPTPRWKTFVDPSTAHGWIDERECPMVVKADWPMAGKGVVVCQTKKEARQAVEYLFDYTRRKTMHAPIVLIEDCVVGGREISFIVMSDGQHVVPLATSQDHKRLQDGDRGPNTGGMGAYSPVPFVDDELQERIMREVMRPALRGLALEGRRLVGFLYAGLMLIQGGGIQVLEFNCRLGDPEAQVILMRLESDLFELLEHGVQGTLHQAEPIRWDERPALGVVLATDGYPDDARMGDAIEGLPMLDPNGDVQAFCYPGMELRTGQLVTAGGRVLCVTAKGYNLAAAAERAYSAVDRISFLGMQYRTDIGYQALGAEGAHLQVA